MNKDLIAYMKEHILCLDGGMGTMLQAAGLPAGTLPERLNLTDPALICDIHAAYLTAGSDVISTNTFGANPLKFEKEELAAVIHAAVANAKAAVAKVGGKPRYIALDIGPTGRLLAPLGDLDFEDAVDIFAETVRLGVAAGVDLIFIETMNDSYETKAALLAAKENCDLPVFVSNAYGADGKLMTGATPAAMTALLEGMGADAIGANCSVGPAALLGVAKALCDAASVPVLLKPNAGLPCLVKGRTVFDVSPADFAAAMEEAARLGVSVMGGCCGTTPDHIAALAGVISGKKPLPITPKTHTVVGSFTHAVEIGRDPVLIGERINPTGKKKLKEALRAGDMNYILTEAIGQEKAGAHLLDVNVGLPGTDETALLVRAVTELQSVTDLPLQIDTADPTAMAAALRHYNGKAMINSVNGKAESMAAIFPLAKKYGGVVVALCLDESGIPTTAAGRLAIAERILAEAAKYGIDKRDIVFDPLAMAVSADPAAPGVTLAALSLIRERTGCGTVLGVSNISFGLPERDAVNCTFFADALRAGLSAAIMNPHAPAMMRTYHAHRALFGLDADCADYISFMTAHREDAAPAAPAGDTLKDAISTGRREQAGTLTRALLSSLSPLEIIDREIIPALDGVGRGFEAGRIFLPQLLMSAEAAQCAAAVIKEALPAGSNGKNSNFPIVIATVRGDIHDIGKNIVRLLLENYGFPVIDLGHDVPPETVLEKAVAVGAKLVGLSALMTTTVPAMIETVKLLHEKLPACPVVVGGAVLTAADAAEMGAAYASDAMATVRYAELLCAQG